MRIDNWSGAQLAGTVLFAALLMAGANGLRAQGDDPEPVPEPLAHELIDNPKDISAERAERIYRAIRGNLQEQYGASGDPVAAMYVQWPRYNTAPYRSSQHGNMFVNNYANEVAAAYKDFERAASMPPGAMVVKDSFVITADGSIIAGPLFLMEKMPAGFDPDNLDWRYMTILGNGEVEGLSSEDGPGGTAYCGACHRRAKVHHLFFVPEAYRP